jgi:hypothetical protein
MQIRNIQLPLCLTAFAIIVLVAATPVGVGAQQASAKRKSPPPDIQAIAGAWSLERTDAKRQCRITLDTEQAGPGWRMRFPSGCRRALPLLNDVTAWLLVAPGQIGLIDATGKVLLRFTPTTSAGRLEARAASGDGYMMEQQGGQTRATRGPTLGPALGTAQPTSINTKTSPNSDVVAGTYIVDRLQGRATCQLVLEQAPSTNVTGLLQMRLQTPCSDSGLKTFDPIGWRYDSGRLWLVARKGHELTLISERDGVWRKDPPTGALLNLRRAP